MRLDKYISDSTAYTRKEIKKLVRAGAVNVEGVTASAADMRVNETDKVSINGETVRYAGREPAADTVEELNKKI